ncbi:amidase [Natronobacillus azotifigens]|uniref:Amidase family protein n=1 Tax=Natronobacillus azotifigens TaxID=472978 RepID=A0A9J6RFV4_9BACI|nr:amidase family protein [Natronobacillus azotifigens]MCZ0704301.1 amidase family protein [Natronobacillus azotifigens]
MSFNSESYIKDQRTKQYETPPVSSYQVERTEVIEKIDHVLKEQILSSDLDGLQMLVKTEQATYADIAKAFYNRVLETKDSNAVITLNQAVIDEAEACFYDDVRDLLYGIPVLVKDNIAVTGLPTTAGAAILKDFHSKEDAEIIQALKAKGALILGKTNLSEWANFMTTKSANGYSAVGGQTKNPFGRFDVGGSSSGSAVAVASKMSPVAIGTETAGSIIYPASQNGVVGLKPTLTTVSQAGIIPIAQAHDTAGPMANTVKDCYTLLKGMATFKETFEDFHQPLTSYRFGQLTDRAITQAYRDQDETIMNTFIERLNEAGVHCVPITLNEDAHEVDITNVLLYQFNAGVRDYFKTTDQPITLSDVFLFNEKDSDNTIPYGQDLIEKARSHTFTKVEIDELIKANQTITTKALDEAFQSVDFLVTLSNYATSLYATSGYPALTLPGFKRESGEPVGITIIGKPNQDIELLYVGHLIHD